MEGNCLSALAFGLEIERLACEVLMSTPKRAGIPFADDRDVVAMHIFPLDCESLVKA
jgi:hypothetical protein